MAPKCVLCRQSYGFGPTVHKLPVDKTYGDKWVDYLTKFLGNDWLARHRLKRSSIRLCSKHFSRSSYKACSASLLKPDAVPSIDFDPEAQRLYDQDAALQITVVEIDPSKQNNATRIVDDEQSLQLLLSSQRYRPCRQAFQQSTPKKSRNVSSDFFALEEIFFEEGQEVLKIEDCTGSGETGGGTSFQTITQNEVVEASSSEKTLTEVDGKPDVLDLTQEKNLAFFLETMKRELLEIESIEDNQLTVSQVNRKDELVSNIKRLEARILSWALTQMQENCILSNSASVTVLESVQADYLLLKKENELLKHLQGRELAKNTGVCNFRGCGNNEAIDISREDKDKLVASQKESPAELIKMKAEIARLKKLLAKKDAILRKNQDQMVAAISLLKKSYGMDT